MTKICIYHSPNVKITFNSVLSRSGRVLVRILGSVKENRLCEKKKMENSKAYPSSPKKNVGHYITFVRWERLLNFH